jgi:hypothetical protein
MDLGPIVSVMNGFLMQVLDLQDSDFMFFAML